MPLPAVIDTHVHLTAPAFDKDRDAVLKRATSGRVTFLEIGLDLSTSDTVVRFAEQNGVGCSLGIHPHYAGAADLEAQWEQIREIASRSSSVKAIGEIGLDLNRDLVPYDQQMNCFVQGLHVAKALGLPVVIHQRDAEEQILKAVTTAGLNSPPVFHCFTGDKAYAKRCLDIGGYLAFGGILTFPKSSELRETVRYVPTDRILVETDCPYLAPQAYRGKRNEPVYVREVVDTIARITGRDPSDVARFTYVNGVRVFGLTEDGTTPVKN